MKLFNLIQLLDAQLDPHRCKVHLATHNGVEDPLDVYLAGNFDEWQSWQRKKNFERDFVVAFISLPPPDKWLFAGAYSVHGKRWNPNRKLFHYDMLRRPSCDELGGRLVARFKRSGRMPYLVGENWADQIQVHEKKPVSPIVVISKRTGLPPGSKLDRRPHTGPGRGFTVMATVPVDKPKPKKTGKSPKKRKGEKK